MDVETLLRPDGWAAEFVRQRAERFVRRQGLNGTDPQDVAQDVYCSILRSWPRFDPERAKPITFLARIVDSSLASYLRHGRRQRRDWRRCVASLDAHELGASRLEPVAAEPSNLDLRLDLEQQVEGLDLRLQQLCHALLRQSRSDAARDLNLHRGTIYERLNLIRKRFEAAGLKAYLPEADTSRVDGVCDLRHSKTRSRSN